VLDPTLGARGRLGPSGAVEVREGEIPLFVPERVLA